MTISFSTYLHEDVSAIYNLTYGSNNPEIKSAGEHALGAVATAVHNKFNEQSVRNALQQLEQLIAVIGSLNLPDHYATAVQEVKRSLQAKVSNHGATAA